MNSKWLSKAVFYEIYPQSFYSPENCGVGTLRGIKKKLQYVKDLGCSGIWINPIYDSPFKDAGYDVRDYKMVAPRYGTNDDARELFEKAHEIGIKVLLDLVPGHTSEEHPWFVASSKAQENEYSGRYVWTDSWFKGIPGRPYIGGECGRDGTYMLNFFKCQPALNYGWLDPKESWQSAIDSPEALATRDAMKDVCLYWLSAGCDGFRVDMADSLVKGDDEKHVTAMVWRDIIGSVKEKFPDCVFVSEWSNPYISINEAGFDMDFYLDHVGNGYNSLLRDYATPGDDLSYFKASSCVSAGRFLREFVPAYEATRENGFISLITGNHDTVRISYNLSERERKVAIAFLLTMPGVPFIYYGDEIGMRYLDIPTKEGGYTRTGSRTPMQWDEETIEAGLKGKLYLSCDDSPDAPTVTGCMKDRDSLFNIVKSLVKIRNSEDSLSGNSPFAVLYEDDNSSLLVYKRGELTVAVNPSWKETSACMELDTSKVMWSIGEGKYEDGLLRMKPQSFTIFKR